MSTVQPRLIPAPAGAGVPNNHPSAVDPTDFPAPGVQVLSAREVPLGGPRAMTVRRTLPHRERSFIGAWCFSDHYGPERVSANGGMDVAPHPHTGLQTVSLLFTGEIEHNDSAGGRGLVRPGEINLMTAGHGISHSEVSTPDTTVLHGMQLWTALPGAHRDTAPRSFENYVPEPRHLPWGTQVEYLGENSPVTVYSRLVLHELLIDASNTATLPLDPTFEYGILPDNAAVTVTVEPVNTDSGDTDETDEFTVEPAALACISPGAGELRITAGGGGRTRVILLGGEPLDESIIMFWNFIGRSHEEVVGMQEEWNRENSDESAEHSRFGTVANYTSHDPDGVSWLPSPQVPDRTKLRPRR